MGKFRIDIAKYSDEVQYELLRRYAVRVIPGNLPWVQIRGLAGNIGHWSTAEQFNNFYKKLEELTAELDEIYWKYIWETK